MSFFEKLLNKLELEANKFGFMKLCLILSHFFNFIKKDKKGFENLK